MKLFTKYNQISIAALTVVFVMGCVAYYFVLKYVLIMELDETLYTEHTEIIAYVKDHNRLPEVVNAYNQQIGFTEIKAPLQVTTYSTQKIKDPEENEFEWIRVLVFGITVTGKNYQVTVSKSQMETEEILQLVILVGAGMMALILLSGYIINQVVIKKLWKPFYRTLHEVEQYQLAKQQTMQLPVSGTNEFDLLNQRLARMTERVQQDYQIVKEFSSNAAHEMQTPLAVIQTQTEALMQDERFLQQHNNSIQTIEQSVNRLTRLNQALLLLAKIDNRQFIMNEAIQLDIIIKEKTEELAELMAAQEITLDCQIKPTSISFNHHLAEVIINNLLNNAIRYNMPGGKIIIDCTPEHFTISNSSVLPALDSEKIARRFYRHPKTRPDGNGLGLSIVDRICEMAGYTLHYYYHNGLHTFSVEKLNFASE